MQEAADDRFHYVLAAVRDDTETRWVLHVHPKKLPIDPVVNSVFARLSLAPFSACTWFNHGQCYWFGKTVAGDPHDPRIFTQNAAVEQQFRDFTTHFTPDVERLAAADRLLRAFDMPLLSYR